MADVLVRVSVPGVALAGAALLKSVDLWGRWTPVSGIVLCAAALVCVFVHERVGAGAIAFLNFVALIGPLYSHNGTLLFWVAMTLAIFRHPVQRGNVLRAQLTVLYGAAALAKFNVGWLSGRILEDVGALVPVSGAVAVATVLAELFLAVALWSPRLRWAVRAVALAMHVAFAALLPGPWSWAVGLIVFNALTVVLLWWTTRSGVSTVAYAGEPSPDQK